MGAEPKVLWQSTWNDQLFVVEAEGVSIELQRESIELCREQYRFPLARTIQGRKHEKPKCWENNEYLLRLRCLRAQSFSNSFDQCFLGTKWVLQEWESPVREASAKKIPSFRILQKALLPPPLLYFHSVLWSHDFIFALSPCEKW